MRSSQHFACSFPDAQSVIEHFHMVPLAGEGGYYVQTLVSPERILVGLDGFPEIRNNPGQKEEAPGKEQPLQTAILYLLTPDTFSAIHRLPSTEIWHYYLGDPVEQIQLFPNGSSKLYQIGPLIFQGERVQLPVPAGVWQGTRLLPADSCGGSGSPCGWTLLGTTMTPGYTPESYEEGRREALIRAYPDRKELICALTRR